MINTILSQLNKYFYFIIFSCSLITARRVLHKFEIQYYIAAKKLFISLSNIIK